MQCAFGIVAVIDVFGEARCHIIRLRQLPA
jgi:hypothetical protein